MGIFKTQENGNIFDKTSRFYLLQDDYKIRNVFHCSLPQKKNLAEKKLKRALPNSPFHLKVVFGEDLLGSLWSFRPILRPCYHVFSCHPMLSHVIPKWPRGENMVTECN